jgi:hypothetical protein
VHGQEVGSVADQPERPVEVLEAEVGAAVPDDHSRGARIGYICLLVAHEVLAIELAAAVGRGDHVQRPARIRSPRASGRRARCGDDPVVGDGYPAGPEPPGQRAPVGRREVGRDAERDPPSAQ